MSKKYNFLEALNFYAENEIDEIYLNTTINRLSHKKEAQNLKTKEVKIEESKPAINPAINVVSSTAQALSQLAKKSQQSAENIGFPQENIDNKFMSLNQIVDSAKSIAGKAKTIAELKTAVENFDGCNLKKMATNTVFCDGNPEAKIMVIGEAPGNHEDLRGIPFCGDSGELLSAMFKSINLHRDSDYYITNVIFWRPPGNRRPTEEELAICKPFVERHIELFKPKLIILVGATAMSAIINTSDTISAMRGKFIDYSPSFLSNKTKIFTIFHPSYLMRQPTKKKLAWQDMLKIKEFISNNHHE